MDTQQLLNVLYKVPRGFRVSWEIIDGCILQSCYWPERGEPLIPLEEMAWAAAAEIASKTYDKWVNFYVIDETFTPVSGYKTRKIQNRCT